MRNEPKTSILLCQDLLPRRIANVAAFLVGGLVLVRLAGFFTELAGEPHRDAGRRI